MLEGFSKKWAWWGMMSLLLGCLIQFWLVNSNLSVEQLNSWALIGCIQCGLACKPSNTYQCRRQPFASPDSPRNTVASAFTVTCRESELRPAPTRKRPKAQNPPPVTKQFKANPQMTRDEVVTKYQNLLDIISTWPRTTKMVLSKVLLTFDDDDDGDES